MPKSPFAQKTEELDSYFSNALDLFCIADTDGYFRRLNPEWSSTLGYPLPDLENRRYIDLVHPDDRAATITMHDLRNKGDPEFCKQVQAFRWFIQMD